MVLQKLRLQENNINPQHTFLNSQRGDSGSISISMNCIKAGAAATPNMYLHVPGTCITLPIREVSYKHECENTKELNEVCYCSEGIVDEVGKGVLQL